ncbi:MULTISPECIES: hypothetical protein [Vibrio]|uniref:hypothetical protein n=1 Tax=Vibrio TaxID=662 RepID=UPI003D0B8F27
MIKTHRNFLLPESNGHHVNIDINPIGHLDIDIVELKEHHDSEFEQLTFKHAGSVTHIQGVDEHSNQLWNIPLHCQDAHELNALILRANDELETLMRDL